MERGYIVPQGRAKLAVRLGEMLDGDEPMLGSHIHRLVGDMRLRWIALDDRIADLNAEFTEAARSDERTRRLLTIPGIGALNATALVAAVGNARTFGRGRDLAAWLGSCRVKRRPGVNLGCSASPSAEASICEKT